MSKFDEDIDALFQLPLSDFIAARKTLAARLKKEGRTDDAERVKLLVKPPISAWAVNQLYWRHREAFDELLSTGQRFRKAQTSGKVANMRDALDARRESVAQLEALATGLLKDAGHNPSIDTIRRISTTLEALSALSDGPTPGRLTQDVDPPGFETFAGFVAPAAASKRVEKPTSPKKSDTAAAKTQQKEEAKRLEQSRQARIGVAKIALQNAKKSVTVARSKALSLEAEKKTTETAAKQAEKHRREAEAFFKKATATSEEAVRRAENKREELDEAERAVTEAMRRVETATKDLEALFREKP